MLQRDLWDKTAGDTRTHICCSLMLALRFHVHNQRSAQDRHIHGCSGSHNAAPHGPRISAFVMPIVFSCQCPQQSLHNQFFVGRYGWFCFAICLPQTNILQGCCCGALQQSPDGDITMYTLHSGSCCLNLCLLTGLILWQRSNEVPVAVDIVHTGCDRPELGLLHPGSWEGSLLTSVGPVPLL